MAEVIHWSPIAAIGAFALYGLWDTWRLWQRRDED